MQYLHSRYMYLVLGAADGVSHNVGNTAGNVLANAGPPSGVLGCTGSAAGQRVMLTQHT